MSGKPFVLRRLAASERGASAVEFALLAPVFFGLMLGVVEVGLYMQNHNAVRSLASEASRFAAIEYQKNNLITEDVLEANIQAIGVASPYNLNASRMVVTVTEVSPARVNGAREFDLDISYALADIIGGTTIDNFTVNYSRPLFVLAGTPAPSPTSTPTPTPSPT